MRGQRVRQPNGVLGLVRKLMARGRQQRRPADGSSMPRASDNVDVDLLISDSEAEGRPRRQLVLDGVHGAYDFEVDGANDIERFFPSGSYSKQDLEKLLEERENNQFRDVEHKQFHAKRVLLRGSKNPQDLMRLAGCLIDEEWLDADEMPGNIYRIGAFGGLAIDTPYVQNTARFLGSLAIFFVQLIGPPGVFGTTMATVVGTDEAYHWDEWTNWEDDDGKFAHIMSDWKIFPVSKFLATLFTFLFSLNGLFVLINEKNSFMKIDSTLRYLNFNTRKFQWSGETLLFLDALMSCWVVFWCCLDSYIVVGNSRRVKDVLFDSLSLLFLFNLDDVGGDLGFVSNHDWDSRRLTWIYEKMVLDNFSAGQPDGYDEEGNPVEDEDFEPSAIFTCLFDITAVLCAVACIVLPILNIFTPFNVIAQEV